MCLEIANPVQIPEVIAYKVMYMNEENELISACACTRYKIGEEYEAQPLKELHLYNSILTSEAYDKGFHAWGELLAAENRFKFHSDVLSKESKKIVLVEVLLKDVQFVEGEKDFIMVYVANKCKFLRVLKEGI